MNAPGLIQQGGANSYTQASCLAAALANPAVLSVDFNTLDVTCWFGYTANPSLVPNGPVNHFNLVNSCGRPIFLYDTNE